MYSGDYEQYVGRHKDPEFTDLDFMKYVSQPTQAIDPNTLLTLEQVTEDLEIYYKALRTQYGAYAYFGDDEAFRPAIDAVIADCAAMEYITVATLADSLLQHLSFVKDAHFSIGGWQDREYIVPFFFRGIAFQKTERGYETPGGKAVASVDGYDDLDALFKRSISRQGELFYCPILLESISYWQYTRGPATCSTPTLTVHYTDGSSSQLSASPYFSSQYSNTSNNAVIEVENGVPVMTVNAFAYPNGGMQFLNYSKDYPDRDIQIMDLRANQGGSMPIATDWANAYAGQSVSGNALYMLHSQPDTEYKNVMSGKHGEFVSLDKTLILLTSKLTVSCGELMTDKAHNMENTLIVGENTNGELRSSIGWITLPNSKIPVSFGDALFLYPDGGYFEEYRGFLPDIWCPADEAKEAVMNFIAKNTTVTME